MRALTVKPHFAHAIAHLGKKCENRTRPPPEAMIGERIAIHAGASLPRDFFVELEADCPRPLQFLWEGSEVWASDSEVVDAARVPWVPIRLRRIVATAEIGGFMVGGDADDLPDWPWARVGSVWWSLRDVRRLVRPVLCQRGQLGLWTLPSATAWAVEQAAWEAA